MKKMYKVFLVLLAFGFAPSLSAQRIYAYLLKQANETIVSPTSNFTRIRLAQFTKQAMIFMQEEGLAHEQPLSETELDAQAYYLCAFISHYYNTVLKPKKCKSETLSDKTKVFTQASLDHPLFPDGTDDDANTFLQSPCSLTPFSLNTNWKLAYEGVK